METKMQGPPMRGNWGAIRDLKGAPRLREFGLFQFFGRLHLVTLHNATCSRVVNYNSTRTRWMTIEWILGDTCERPRGREQAIYRHSLCFDQVKTSPACSASILNTCFEIFGSKNFLRTGRPKIFFLTVGNLCTGFLHSPDKVRRFFFVDCFPNSLKTILTHESLIMTRPSFAFYIKIRQWVELYIRFGNY